MRIYKKLIQSALNKFGYRITKTRNAFAVQQNLVSYRDPKDIIIFDIGAHVGTVAKLYRTYFPGAKIHCFEPFPPSFEQLSKNLNADSLCFLYDVAVQEDDSNTVFQINKAPETNSLLSTDSSGIKFWGQGVQTIKQINVKTISIDLFCHQKSIKNIDVLKIDVQGAEYRVLMGALDMLQKNRISIIYLELIMCPTYEKQHKLNEYFSLLDKYGYAFFDYYTPVRRGNRMIQADVLFVNSNILKEYQ